MTSKDLKTRTKHFAHRCVKLALALPESYLGKHIRRQTIRAATSVAANYRAACLAQSTKAFVAKISIPIEEADECYFWIEFAVDEHLIKAEKCNELLKEAKELTAIFVASRNTARKKL